MSFEGEPRMSGAGGGENGDGGGSRRHSNASAGGGGSRKGSAANAGEAEARLSAQSGGNRVSFGGDDEQGPRGSKTSRGSAYEEVKGEQEDTTGYAAPQMLAQDEHEPDCTCSECECPDEEEEAPPKKSVALEEPGDSYQLDEFMRAKSYFQQISNKSGLSLYDHLSDVIRKFLDERAPNNPVDYLEEVSMNVKRYRFGLKKEEYPLQDSFALSEPVLNDAKRVLKYWRDFGKSDFSKKETQGEGYMFPGGGFQNLLRLQYYLEMVNIGLSREEMFRAALGIKELTSSRPQIGKLRFWGKIFGTLKNYYVVEAELAGGTDQASDMWNAKDDENHDGAGTGDGDGKKLELDAVQTFSRAKNVVLNNEILQAYSKTSGLAHDKQMPKGGAQRSTKEWDGEGAGHHAADAFGDDPDSRSDAMKWQAYQQELMENFPTVKTSETVKTPAEPDGSGVNRRVFYVCNELGGDWILLPPVTPQQINVSRSIRWFLSGNLDNSIKTNPPFPGKEGHYLKALLARITAGGMCSPKGYFRTKGGEGEYGGEDDELEGEDGGGGGAPGRSGGSDAVTPVKRYQPDLKALINPKLNVWVHHTNYILSQGRTTWWNPSSAPKQRRRTASADVGSEIEEEDEEDEDEDEELDLNTKESAPPLFSPVSSDKAGDGRGAWSLSVATSVFPESQVVCIRSNVWPGSNCVCTNKGKVSNIYFGDGLKFFPITYCPPQADPTAKEYRSGPELDETRDPTVEEEQSWLEKLALSEIADMEAKFVDNEDGFATGDEDDETEYEY